MTSSLPRQPCRVAAFICAGSRHFTRSRRVEGDELLLVLDLFAPERRAGVVEIEAEWNPPDEIVGDAEDGGFDRPLAVPDLHHQADRAENFAKQADQREKPASLRNARDFEVED